MVWSKYSRTVPSRFDDLIDFDFDFDFGVFEFFFLRVDPSIDIRYSISLCASLSLSLPLSPSLSLSLPLSLPPTHTLSVCLPLSVCFSPLSIPLCAVYTGSRHWQHTSSAQYLYNSGKGGNTTHAHIWHL
jgi:hypothetical protein